MVHNIKVSTLRGCLHHGPWNRFQGSIIKCVSSHDHLGLYQGKKGQSDHGVRCPQKTCLRPILSTNMVQRVLQWERQKRWSGRKTQDPMTNEKLL